MKIQIQRLKSIILNLFPLTPKIQTGKQTDWTGRSVSATPDRETGNWKGDQRRSSTSSTGSVRSGGGLIETGKPVKQSFLPFGASTNPIKPNYVIKKAPNRSRSQSRPPTGPPAAPQTSQTATTTSRSTSNGAGHQQQQQQVSTSLNTSSSSQQTTIDTTKVEQHSTTISMMQHQTEKSSVSTSISTASTSAVTGVAFKELDIALKKVAKEQEEAAVSVEVTIPRKPRRARSLSRNNTETLPDEVLNIIRVFFMIHK